MYLMSDVTEILGRIESGDSAASEQLLPIVYNELRKLAASKLAHEAPGHTLQPTALVHEAYVRLVAGGEQPSWDNQRHFFAAAAEAMRRILIDAARRKARPKHGGDRHRVGLEQTEAVADSWADELLRVNDALDRLTLEDQTAGEVVKLCYIAGLTVEQAANALGISRATAYRHWTYAKAWLHNEIKRGSS